MGEMSFDQAMKRIEEIVADLEKGEIPLEKSLDLFEEAVRLAGGCQKKLEKAQARITKLTRTGEQGFTLEPFEETRDD
jgi:exodeoxyribonuclease VII small subunit